MPDGRSPDGSSCNDDPNTGTCVVYASKKAGLFELLWLPADARGREAAVRLDRLSNHSRIRCEARGHACFHMP
jgi:hypothetical protein